MWTKGQNASVFAEHSIHRFRMDATSVCVCVRESVYVCLSVFVCVWGKKRKSIILYQKQIKPIPAACNVPTSKRGFWGLRQGILYRLTCKGKPPTLQPASWSKEAEKARSNCGPGKHMRLICLPPNAPWQPQQRAEKRKWMKLYPYDSTRQLRRGRFLMRFVRVQN